MNHERFIQRAIELSAQALELPGTEPFGAVIVKDGSIVGEGINRSALNNDPTSHGETEAIRDACRNLQTVDLRGCELYSSCEPCALCVAAMEIAGITKLYYAAGLEQANAVISSVPASVRSPIDSNYLRNECGKPAEQRQMPAMQMLDREAEDVLRAWAAKVAAAGASRSG